jgi:integrase/recombinase XerD
MYKLKDQFIEDLTLKGLSKKTIASYVSLITGLAKYHQKNPAKLNEADVREYLLYLIKTRKLSSSTVNRAHTAFSFLYEVTLGQKLFMARIPKMKRKITRLPLVLSPAEISALLAQITNLKYLALIQVIYSAGLRISEAVNLKVTDIDSTQMRIRINLGKGGWERFGKLSKLALQTLRTYYKAYQPEEYLFFGLDKKRPIHSRSVAIVFKKALAQAKISKPAVLHSLRHSFATHLLDQKVHLTTIQKLLGHRSIKSTAIYIHVSHKTIREVVSPLDNLAMPDHKAPL